MTHLTTHQLGIQIASKIVCTQLDLKIAPGEFWGILGQNGSGKTTLLHTLGGLQTPHSGEIYLADKKLAQHSLKKRAQLLGLLFQKNHAAFPQTVWEYCLSARYSHFNLFLESKTDREATQKALETMQLDHQLEQNILTLSGGEWRRLALATLLTQNPSVYLLDEPLNHLDLRHQHLVLRYFREQTRHKKISVLMALHDINMAEQYCDKVLLIFGEGRTRIGLKNHLLTEEQLSDLYGHPLRLLQAGEKRWWIAD